MASRKQELRVVISGDVSHLSRAFAKAGTSASHFEGKIQSTTSRVAESLRHLSVGAFGGLGLGIGVLVKGAVDYEKQMARVRGVTNATGVQMQSLGGLAKKLGEDTKFSAGEAATAMYELGSAGFKVNDMAQVLPATLALAAASSIDMKSAAEIASNALNGFGLSGDKMGHVADVLAQTVNRTSTEMGDLQHSLKYIGPIARLTGQDFETMLAAIGELGNAGIKGEQAGTTLRGGLVRLTKPTKMVEAGFASLHLKSKDLYGPKGLKPLTQIIPILEHAMNGVSKSTRNAALAQIFGTEAATGWAALIQQGTQALIKNTKANRESEGSAEKAAKIMDSTVAGAWENLTGSIETVGITVFEKFEVPVRHALLHTAHLVNEFPKHFKTLMAGGRSAATSLTEAFGTAFGLESNNQRLSGALEDMFRQVDWRGIGGTIADGISGGVKLSGDFAHSVEAGIGLAMSHIDGRKVLSGLLRVIGEAIDALFSPKFWIDNFSNILATVTIAFPVAKILRIPGADALYRFISVPFFKAVKFLGKGFLKLFGKVGEDGVTGFLAGLERLAPKTAVVLLDLVTGTGKWLRGLPGKFRGAANSAINALVGLFGKGVGEVAGAVGRLAGGAIKGLGKLVPDFLRQGVRMGAELVTGIIKGVKGLPGKIGGAIKSAIKAVGGFFGAGEGIGRTMSAGGGSGGGSSDLKGARASMGPFAAIGKRFRLHVSSGLRTGAITSSGNVSYHSTGEAIDEAGSPADMMGFFKYMKERFGGRLAELIYTPGGIGVKNGQPFRYTGQVAADHFDHVHVALDTGAPGVGDGLGKFVATAYGPPWRGPNGTGVTAAGVNLKNSPHIYGIAADPNVLKMGSSVKVQPNPFGHSGSFKVFDTGSDIKGNRIDFYDWRGRSSQMGWGRKTVTVSTASGGSSGDDATARDALDAHLKRNLDKLDTLRNQLAEIPRGKKTTAQRRALQAQIRGLVASNRSIRSDIRGAPSATDIKAGQERAGSRLVNRITAPYAKGISAASKRAATLGTAIEDADTAYGQVDRIFGMSEEDLGTPGGKKHRIGELTALAALKVKTLGDQKKRAKVLVGLIAKYDAELKKLRAARGKAKGAKRAKMNERIRPIVSRRDDLAAEAKALGESVTTTALDIADLVKEAGTVATTEDTSVSSAVSATQEKIAQAMSDIDLMERAGLITSDQAASMRVATLQAASVGKFGGLDQRGLLEVLAQLGDASQAQAEAATQAAAEVSANTQAIKDLIAEMAANTAATNSILAVEYRTALGALADTISGQIVGHDMNPRALVAASGALARY